jgi:KDO2-lipid IV(A) lauroyltransferase
MLLTLRHLFEYAALRAVWALLRIVPARHAFGLGAAMGSLWFRGARERRGIAIGNLLKTGVAASPQEAHRIARASFRHFTGHMLETIKVPHVLTRANWREHVEVEASEEAIGLLQNPDQPVLMATAHLGCWEIAGFWASLFRPVFGLARPMNNPYVQRFLVQDHFRTNLTILPKSHGFSPELLRSWEERKAALAILMDQHAGRNGIWMDFLGRPASVHSSPARLHLITGFPLLFGCFVRLGPLRYRMIVTRPIYRAASPGDRDQDTRVIIEDLTHRLETLIRRYPEQYLWMHRRWREQPAGKKKKGEGRGTREGVRG